MKSNDNSKDVAADVDETKRRSMLPLDTNRMSRLRANAAAN